MSLNIKNPETYRLAVELAQRTGTSMTEAVTEALRDKLAALAVPEDLARREQDRARVIADVKAIAKTIRDRLGPEGVAALDVDTLYDERGLPK